MTRAGHFPDGGGDLASQRQIAARFGVSRARVQQLEQRALDKLRKEIVRQARAAGCTPREWLLGDE
jgi:DNA-directed RNA polymerase sigma subunit (sigma70/sigma32)